jgi:hypothetical protein
MAESVTQSEQNHCKEATQTVSPVEKTNTPDKQLLTSPTPDTLIIWTPGFILLFATILVVGLSSASLLTQGMVNGNLYPMGAVLCGYDILLLGFWIALIRSSRMFWLRAGGLCGSIWSILACGNALLSTLPLASTTSLLVQLSAATASAFLATSTCLSMTRTPFKRWDSWFFYLSLPLAACITTLLYFSLPPLSRSIDSLEIIFSQALLTLAMLAWWLRPSCWRTLPGPTFLFGSSALLQMLVAIPGLPTAGDRLFFSQVALLLLLLGILRLIQGERRLQISCTA